MWKERTTLRGTGQTEALSEEVVLVQSPGCMKEKSMWICEITFWNKGPADVKAWCDNQYVRRSKGVNRQPRAL